MEAALKEWDVVCRALELGLQSFILRKGGIAEGRGGFTIKHESFLLFPTWEHQKTEYVRPEFHHLFRPEPAPETITFTANAEVDDVAIFNEIPEPNIFSDAYFDLRKNYKPQNPLYVIRVRVTPLPEPLTIPNLKVYAGCRSWVEHIPEHSVAFP